jgi:hypothetical protein
MLMNNIMVQQNFNCSINFIVPSSDRARARLFQLSIVVRWSRMDASSDRAGARLFQLGIVVH